MPLTVIRVRKCSASVTNKGLGSIFRPDSESVPWLGRTEHGDTQKATPSLHRPIQLSTYLDSPAPLPPQGFQPARSPTNAQPTFARSPWVPPAPFPLPAVRAGLPAAGRGLGLPCEAGRGSGRGGGGDSVAETEVWAMAVNLSRNGPKLLEAYERVVRELLGVA